MTDRYKIPALTAGMTDRYKIPALTAGMTDRFKIPALTAGMESYPIRHSGLDPESIGSR